MAEWDGNDTIAMESCARCQKPHEQLEVHPLAHPEDEWTHWAWCPTIGQPIFVRFVPKKETPE